jgi:hypothetical protein
MLMALTMADFLDKHWDSIVELLNGLGAGILVLAFFYLMYRLMGD